MLAVISEHSLGRRSCTHPQVGPWAERGRAAQVAEGSQAAQWPGVAKAHGPQPPDGLWTPLGPVPGRSPRPGDPRRRADSLGSLLLAPHQPRVLNLWEPRPGSQALCWSLFYRTKETSRAGSESRRARSPFSSLQPVASRLCSGLPRASGARLPVLQVPVGLGGVGHRGPLALGAPLSLCSLCTPSSGRAPLGSQVQGTSAPRLSWAPVSERPPAPGLSPTLPAHLHPGLQALTPEN